MASVPHTITHSEESGTRLVVGDGPPWGVLSVKGVGGDDVTMTLTITAPGTRKVVRSLTRTDLRDMYLTFGTVLIMLEDEEAT